MTILKQNETMEFDNSMVNYSVHRSDNQLKIIFHFGGAQISDTAQYKIVVKSSLQYSHLTYSPDLIVEPYHSFSMNNIYCDWVQTYDYRTMPCDIDFSTIQIKLPCNIVGTVYPTKPKCKSRCMCGKTDRISHIINNQ